MNQGLHRAILMSQEPHRAIIARHIATRTTCIFIVPWTPSQLYVATIIEINEPLPRLLSPWAIVQIRIYKRTRTHLEINIILKSNKLILERCKHLEKANRTNLVRMKLRGRLRGLNSMVIYNQLQLVTNGVFNRH